jgi:hypothetical protein
MDADTKREATPAERRAAFIIHGDHDIQIDADALAADAIDGIWVQAWVWVNSDQLTCYGYTPTEE